MSSFSQKETKCPCCANPLHLRLLRGFFSPGPFGLDGNPHQSEIFETVQICPNCGYASRRMLQPVDATKTEMVESDEYQELFRSEQYDLTVRKFLLAAKLDKMDGDYYHAAGNALIAEWYLQDQNQKDIGVLKETIEYLSKSLKTNADVPQAIALVDCLRRAEMYEESKDAARELMQYVTDDRIRTILGYEIQLAEKQDAKPHLQEDANENIK